MLVSEQKLLFYMLGVTH